jgi:uncharacterized protein
MLTIEDKKYFINKIKEIEQNKKVFEMQNYIQHGDTNTFVHCISVSYFCYAFAKSKNMKLDYDSLIRGAFLHDFYLYDWHEKSMTHRMHGFIHPTISLENANKYFGDINLIEKNMIESHMWPLTLNKIPKCKEAFILTLVDKYCGFLETFKLDNANHFKVKGKK